jgi:glycine/D-amino acid oxidase-like deaminating enzyme
VPEIVVVGAGLVGSAVAYFCARAGAKVTVIDAGRPGGGTSSTTFSWLNANRKTPRAYFDLNVAGMRAHAALRDELGSAPWLHDGGNLEWAADDAGRAELRDRVERLRAWGYEVSMVSPGDVGTQLAPDLQMDRGVKQVAYFPEERWLDPLPLIGTLLNPAGASIEIHQGRVEQIEVATGVVRGVRTAAHEQISAEVVVDCAGRWAGHVAAMAGFTLPMANTAGLLAVTAPAPVGLSRIVHAPDVNIRPDGAGRFLLHADDLDAAIDAATQPDVRLPACAELLRRARNVLPGLEGAPLEAARIGVRPIPGDGLSAVGPMPGVEGVYLAVTHSGATLCLALGRMVAGELLRGEQAPELAAFRPARFHAGARTGS